MPQEKVVNHKGQQLRHWSQPRLLPFLIRLPVPYSLFLLKLLVPLSPEPCSLSLKTRSGSETIRQTYLARGNLLQLRELIQYCCMVCTCRAVIKINNALSHSTWHRPILLCTHPHKHDKHTYSRTSRSSRGN